jgi:hypothetical protein
MKLTWINARMNGGWSLKAAEMLILKNLYGVSYWSHRHQAIKILPGLMSEGGSNEYGATAA